MRLGVLTFTMSKLALAGLAQAQIIPDEFSSILVQLPLVGLFAWYVLYSNKQNREWLDHLMKGQSERHLQTINLFEKILERMDIRQREMADQQKEMADQLALNTATVNESMRLGELGEQLKEIVKKGE